MPPVYVRNVNIGSKDSTFNSVYNHGKMHIGNLIVLHIKFTRNDGETEGSVALSFCIKIDSSESFMIIPVRRRFKFCVPHN